MVVQSWPGLRGWILRPHECPPISDMLKIVGQLVMMPSDCAPLCDIFLKSYEITMDRLSDTSHPRIFCLNVYNYKKE